MTEEPTKQQKEQEGTATPAKQTSLGEAIGAGVAGGVAAGFASYYLTGGEMTFPIFLVASLFILGGLKGWGKIVGLVGYAATAALVVAILENPFFQLSDKPELPPPADSLHGASSPAEMNRIVDTLLSAGSSAIDHDSTLTSKMRIGIIAMSALVVCTALLVVVRRHRPQCPPIPVWRTVLLILMLAIPVIAITVTASFMKDRLLQCSDISKALRNENTSPPVVRKGTTVRVEIPTTLQSFFGYHECSSLKMKRSVATLLSGEQVPLTLADARLRDGGRKPGKSDLIPLMENVELSLQFTVPDDPKLCGALLDIAASGSLNLVPSNSKEPIAHGDFDAAAQFRVARDQEADFQATYDELSGRATGCNLFSFSAAAFVIFTLAFFSPWVCRKCRGKVNALKITDGHLCPKCFKEQQKASEKEKKAEEDEVPVGGK